MVSPLAAATVVALGEGEVPVVVAFVLVCVGDPLQAFKKILVPRVAEP
jgi:hypothetical protein